MSKKNPAVKMVAEQYRRRWAGADDMLSADVRAALVDSLVLGVCLGQDASLKWPDVQRHTQDIRWGVMVELGLALDCDVKVLG